MIIKTFGEQIMKKFFCFLLCIIMFVSVFAGCGSKTESIDLIYPFGGNINSYDPQVASTSDEFLIAENCFEGLVRSDDEGNILKGSATSWQVSDDGLTYTFYLKTGLKWRITSKIKERMGENFDPEITADDFVFALRRAADPTTQCPLYSTISSIENAPEINAGRRDRKELGVRAIDNYTLQIRLSSPDSGFLQTLSTAVAMPCNEEFFYSTNGRYGLSLEYTLFNGQFAITHVLDESYILKNNESYKGVSPAPASDLTLKIVNDDESLSEQLISGYYDAAYIRGYESAEINEKSGITLVPYSNTTWAIVMNSSKGILQAADARHAFALALSEIDYESYPYLTDALGFIPPSCTIQGKPYTESATDVTERENSEKAVDLWKTAVDATSIYTIDITVLAPENMEEIAKLLLQGVQSSIGAISNAQEETKISFSLVLETKPESEVRAAVNSGEYDIALYPFTAGASSPVSFLQTFSDKNITSFITDDFIAALDSARSEDAGNLASACGNCEKKLIESFCYAPLFYETRYYASAKGVSGVLFHPGSGRVCFVYATRKD